MGRPKLIPEWRQVLNRAWSARLMLLSGALLAAPDLLSVFEVFLDEGTFKLLSSVAMLGAFCARFIDQKEPPQ